jgi:hypothetical protein
MPMKMKNKIAGAAVVLAAAAGFGKAFGIPPVEAPAAALRYRASCSLVDFNSVDGYVSNLSPDTYRVAGAARFKFSTAKSMSHPDLLVQANGEIPPGETVRVSRSHLPFELLPGETCRFKVTGAIRKE